MVWKYYDFFLLVVSNCIILGMLKSISLLKSKKFMRSFLLFTNLWNFVHLWYTHQCIIHQFLKWAKANIIFTSNRSGIFVNQPIFFICITIEIIINTYYLCLRCIGSTPFFFVVELCQVIPLYCSLFQQEHTYYLPILQWKFHYLYWIHNHTTLLLIFSTMLLVSEDVCLFSLTVPMTWNAVFEGVSTSS